MHLKFRYYLILTNSIKLFDIQCLYTYISENKTIELHSPDGVHFCILKTQEASEATCWFNTLHGALNVLSLKALHDANKVLLDMMPALGQLHHIGWLFRVNRNEVC